VPVAASGSDPGDEPGIRTPASLNRLSRRHAEPARGRCTLFRHYPGDIEPLGRWPSCLSGVMPSLPRGRWRFVPGVTPRRWSLFVLLAAEAAFPGVGAEPAPAGAAALLPASLPGDADPFVILPRPFVRAGLREGLSWPSEDFAARRRAGRRRMT